MKAVYVWLLATVVQLKPTQHYKAIILQLEEQASRQPLDAEWR